MISRAEAERLVAEAVAVERNKRRRVQLALAAAVGLLLVAGGSFAWWQEKAREQRQLEQEAREAERARVEEAHHTETVARQRQNAAAAQALLDLSKRAMAEHRLGSATEALQEAERRVAEGGAEQLQERLDRVRGELALMQKLDDIDYRNWSLFGRGFEVAPPPREVVRP
jgi:hypothetical protein